MKNIYDMTYAALGDYFLQRGQNKAKAKIIFNYLYKNIPHNLGKKITDMLAFDFSCGKIEILDMKSSADTVKFLFGLHDGNTIETVLMRHGYGSALCVSTQVGCNMGCAFCKSGENKKIRDLLPHEMVLQILKTEEALGERISRVTLMGVGEPLDNYENTADFINIIGHRHGLGIAPRHITVSTCGLLPEIKRLQEDEIPCNLAVSLNAPNDEIRSRLMPINKTYNINLLLEVIPKNKKTTLEYVLLDGVNDSDENARELVNLIGGINCYINLIPYNETGLKFKRPDAEIIKSFYEILIQGGVRTVVRKEFGADIKAACGQLRAERNKI